MNAAGMPHPGYVRQEENGPEDSEQCKAGATLERRKEPPLPEAAGDAFDRQRLICGFDHGLVARQTVLVLGLGGVGQGAALALARLGVGAIILVDAGVYEASDLNRQCLGSPSQVGRAKVEVALETLRAHHLVGAPAPALEGFRMDALAEWAQVVRLARRSDAVFNAMGAGPLWDHAVNGLCLELGLPLVRGESEEWSARVDLASGREGTRCQVQPAP
mmetsp:Transcript_50863/g.115512  ORF Transcript_50863/g.115512 Transcript_50863/m.115512 type:complete len:218 (+) Transcript_50863:319-972(+)